MNKQERLEVWKSLKKISQGQIKASYIRDLKLFKGMAGICRDESGLAISFLHTGKKYPDDVFDTGLTYHYPETDRKGSHDKNEIESAKQCLNSETPIFIILPGNEAETRTIKLGWIIDYDDNSKMFLIEYSDFQPEKRINQLEEQEKEFVVTANRSSAKAFVKVRQNQARFRLNLFKKYGSKCAVCNIRNKYLLDAAHIIPVEKNGTDDWRNGLLLCKNHHVAFDRKLFKIKTDYQIEQSPKMSLDELQINEDNISTETGLLPHKDALAYVFDQ
jgi:putative restriction endonuclease